MYLIDTPPPTISGDLHIGHIFSYTLGDISARYQKYLGNDLVYPFCYDCNGIPTGKLAANKNIKGLDNILDFAKEKSVGYKNDFMVAGISFSDTSYSTYDEYAIEIAYQTFELLKNKGIIYKANTETLWSEQLNCSISQSELDHNDLIERTGEIPIIKKCEGWFINIKDNIELIRTNIDKIEWKPKQLKVRIDDWLDNIEYDWSISRNRNFGIPIPNEIDMTFDTWFISALSPQMAWSAHIKEPTLNAPIFDLRFQSHDIIRTWAFYTIAMSTFINNQIPFHTIMISGHVLDGKGNKFSKSSGNATVPKPLILKYNQHGIRHWASSTAIGIDIKIDEEKMKMGYRISNKFINAKKYVDKQLESMTGESTELLNVWQLYKKNILSEFESMNYHIANELIYKFLFDILCGTWIEYSKKNPIPNTLKYVITEFEPIFNIIYE